MIQRLKIALHFMQSSKLCTLAFPTQDQLRIGSHSTPGMPPRMTRWAQDKLVPKWSTCCQKDNPDAQGGLELSDLNSYSFPLKGKLNKALPVPRSERLHSLGSHDGTQSPPVAQVSRFPLMLASLKGLGDMAAFIVGLRYLILRPWKGE